MDENITKMLTTVSMVLLVMGALSLFFPMYRSGSGTVNLVNRSLTDRGVVYQAESGKSDTVFVTGDHIIGIIRNGPETDLIIDSVVIPATVDTGTFNYQIIDSAALYSVDLITDPSGQVSAVVYRKK